MLSAQSTADLKEKRKRLLQEIEQTNSKLGATRRDKLAKEDALKAIRSRIRHREELIGTLQRELEYTDASIDRTTDVIGALESDVEHLRDEYSRTLRVTYRHHLTHSWLSFLFSATSLNDAFRRWQYLRQYHKYRQRQARLIYDTQETLRTKLAQLERRRAEKAELLSSTDQQRELLLRERADQDLLLGQLKTDEERLVAQIKQKERDHAALTDAIERAIAAEMERARKASRRSEPTADAGPAAVNADAENEAVAAASAEGKRFAAQKGKLSWPVSARKITRRFGRQPHPTVRNIQISNNGIDIATSANEPVAVVYEGTVVSTHYVPGYRHTVLVKHGDYYTVYSNLEVLSVDKGASLSQGQILGYISAEGGDLHFELWREKQRLNPESWIVKR